MVYFKENYNFSKVPGVCERGSNIFGGQGGRGCPTFSRGDRIINSY